jgi:hypothetical protein
MSITASGEDDTSAFRRSRRRSLKTPAISPSAAVGKDLNASWMQNRVEFSLAMSKAASRAWRESNPWARGFRVKSDVRNRQAIVQPRLYDCLMVTQMTLKMEGPHGFDSRQGHSYRKVSRNLCLPSSNGSQDADGLMRSPYSTKNWGDLLRQELPELTDEDIEWLCGPTEAMESHEPAALDPSLPIRRSPRLSSEQSTPGSGKGAQLELDIQSDQVTGP